MHPLSADETRKLLEAARGDKHEALYVLAIHTGMRQDELLALKWQDVDMENATVSVRRTLTKTVANCSWENRRRRRAAAPSS
jgi:integrase